MSIRPRPHLVVVLVLASAIAGCDQSGKVPEIKGTGVFIQAAGTLIEVPRLGTLGNSYGPRLYPDLPEYDIPVVPDVGPIYVNIPGLSVATLEGLEWHGYRLGGNAPAGSRSTARVQDWKSVPVITEQTKVPGLFKVVVAAADARTERWKPELNHEYFGITTDGGYKDKPVWAVRIK
jgi:hypothetical protein